MELGNLQFAPLRSCLVQRPSYSEWNTAHNFILHFLNKFTEKRSEEFQEMTVSVT
jgi:hypothetical protein